MNFLICKTCGHLKSDHEENLCSKCYCYSRGYRETDREPKEENTPLEDFLWGVGEAVAKLFKR